MRLAVVADIHGNIRGLKAVLADLKRTSPDAVVNLGDCVSGPLEAAETCDLLMDLGWQTIRGNHDRWLVERRADGAIRPGCVRGAHRPQQGVARRAAADGHGRR